MERAPKRLGWHLFSPCCTCPPPNLFWGVSEKSAAPRINGTAGGRKSRRPAGAARYHVPSCLRSGRPPEIRPCNGFTRPTRWHVFSTATNRRHEMKTIDVDRLQPDPLAAALASTDKEIVTTFGYICAVGKTTISISATRDGTSYIEYPRSAVIAAFTDEDSEQVTLLVEANARVKAISAMQAGMLIAQMRAVGGTGCGTTCKSGDGEATCCCGVGQRCRSLSKTCVCEDASRPLSPEVVGKFDGSSVIAGLDPIPDLENNLNWPGSPSTAAQSEPGGPSTVPSGYGRNCKQVPYWICAGNRCWIEYAWVCTYYPLPRAQSARRSG